jgi:hypothetical protein
MRDAKESRMHSSPAVVGMMLVVLRRLRDRYDRTSERGDVPGWVMVTVMTAGLVAAIWALAGPELERMLRDALRSVA